MSRRQIRLAEETFGRFVQKFVSAVHKLKSSLKDLNAERDL